MSQQTVQNRGRILKIKTGYNPNSSSVGSELPLFFVFAVSSGSLAVFVLNLLNTYDRMIRRKKGQDDEEPTAKDR